MTLIQKSLQQLLMSQQESSGFPPSLTFWIFGQEARLFFLEYPQLDLRDRVGGVECHEVSAFWLSPVRKLSPGDVVTCSRIEGNESIVHT